MNRTDALAATLVVVQLATSSPKTLFTLYEVVTNSKTSPTRKKAKISGILQQYHARHHLMATINARQMLEWLQLYKADAG